MTFQTGDDDSPYCEVCGEQHATCRTDHVGVCDDCFESAIRDALREAGLFENACASVWRQRNGHLAVCLAPYGVEHVH